LTAGACAAIATWMMFPWRPSLPVRNSGVGPLVRVGRDLTVFNVTYFISASLDQILLGRFWGPAIVGLYRQAQQLVSIPNQVQLPFQYVSLPALSRLQNEPERYR